MAVSASDAGLSSPREHEDEEGKAPTNTKTVTFMCKLYQAAAATVGNLVTRVLKYTSELLIWIMGIVSFLIQV